MDHLQYYEGLNNRELVHHDVWLIVIKEAAEYCKSRGVDYIIFSRLKERSGEALFQLTRILRYSFGGSFESIVYSSRCKKYLRVEKIMNKSGTKSIETRIYPKISLIDKEFEARRAENLKPGNKRLTTMVAGLDQKNARRPIDTETVPVSATLGGSVTYADKRKGTKIL